MYEGARSMTCAWGDAAVVVRWGQREIKEGGERPTVHKKRQHTKFLIALTFLGKVFNQGPTTYCS